MKFTSQPFDLSQLVISDEQKQERTKGIHVSGIIKHVKEQLKLQRGGFDEYDLGQFATVGRLWEWALEEAIFNGPRYVRPGSLWKDGIWVTPDSVDMDVWMPQEFKCTWVSSRHDIDSERFQHYLWQMKAQCEAMETDRARAIVVHVCGNWRDKPTPVARDYQLWFSRQELRDNWKFLLNNARTM